MRLQYAPSRRIMRGIAPPMALMFAACTPSSQKAAMSDPSAAPENTVRNAEGPGRKGDGPANSDPGAPAGGKLQQAAQGPMPEPASAAENPAPAPLADSHAAASGRRILSTAFVRVGPDGHLTVELQDGRAVVLRDVVMGPKSYCGIQVAGGPSHAKYCGEYAEVIAARPGGVTAGPDRVDAAANPVKGK